jgi:hypothetical protein
VGRGRPGQRQGGTARFAELQARQGPRERRSGKCGGHGGEGWPEGRQPAGEVGSEPGGG